MPGLAAKSCQPHCLGRHLPVSRLRPSPTTRQAADPDSPMLPVKPGPTSSLALNALSPLPEIIPMIDDQEMKSFVVDVSNLPANFPTHRHAGTFWEALGRAVATFGFLEEVLGKAIFSVTATRRIPDNKLESAFEKWLPLLEKALSDPLGGLIDSYGKAVRSNSNASITNLDELLDKLRNASNIRNVLCHGSWRAPDEQGRSLPFFVNRKALVFDTPIDVAFLHQVQLHVAELACEVVSSVTQMGLQFPGSSGPGVPIFVPRRGEAREG